MTMQTLTYQVGFNTPTFLGNAEQQAQWRTPPFKALLRQWWRVVKAPEADSTSINFGIREHFGHADAALNSHTGVLA